MGTNFIIYSVSHTFAFFQQYGQILQKIQGLLIKYLHFCGNIWLKTQWEDTYADIPHTVTGRYFLETDPAIGAIIRGDYDHDSGDWAHRYVIKDLTATSMIWVAKDNPDYIQKYERVDYIPVK
jgi:hypothetical protein